MEHEPHRSRRVPGGGGAKHGEAVFLVARTIATWGDGTTAWPQARYRRILQQVTGRTAQELGFTPPARRVRVAAEPDADRRTEEGGDEMRRRSILLRAGAAVLTAAVPTADNPRPALGQDHLQALLETEQQLYAQDRDHGSADLKQQSTTALHTARSWLTQGRYGEDLGRQLHTATGMLSVAAGWLALDAGRTTDARSLYTEALANARQADDPGLGSPCLRLPVPARPRHRPAPRSRHHRPGRPASSGWTRLTTLARATGHARGPWLGTARRPPPHRAGRGAGVRPLRQGLPGRRP